MNLFQNEIDSAVSSSLDAYTWHEPSNKRSAEYRAHKLVAQLINAHLIGVQCESDICERVKDLDGFVRQLQAEFDCIYIDLSVGTFPKTIERLSKLKPNPILAEYHSLVVKLLKIILVRVQESSNPTLAEQKLSDFIMAVVQVFSPPAKVQPRYTEVDVQDEKQEVDKLIEYYLDINF